MKPAIILIAIGASMGLAGCASVGPDYQGPPKLELADKFSGATEPQGEPSPYRDEWWTRLGDSRLDSLIDRALAENLDLQIATERVVQSRALRRQVASAFLPQVAAAGGFANVGFSENTADFVGQAVRAGAFPGSIDQWDAGTDVSWEIDVFGRGRRKSEAARSRIDLAVADAHATRLAVAAEVADAYFTIVGFLRQIAAVEENIRLQTETLKLIEQLSEAGLGSRLDVQRASSQLESTRAAKPTLDAGLTAQFRRLTLVLGASPSSLDDQRANWADFPEQLPMVRTGLPADLLVRRPDLRRAERQLSVASAEIGVAKANFYPRFFLLGQPEVVSGGPANLFDPGSIAWQFAPRFEWALFSSGRNRALLKAANSRQQESLLSYEKSVLQAVGEVESQLASLKANHRRFASLSGAVNANVESVRLAKELYREGRSNLLALLVEEQRLTVLTLDRIRSQTSLVLSWIRLHRALGGGWQSAS